MLPLLDFSLHSIRLRKPQAIPRTTPHLVRESCDTFGHSPAATCHGWATGAGPARPLHLHRRQIGGLGKFGFHDPLARRGVKQDRIPLHLPDCGEFHASGSVEAEKDAAGLATASQDPLGKGEDSQLQLILIANRFVYVFLQSLML